MCWAICYEVGTVGTPISQRGTLRLRVWWGWWEPSAASLPVSENQSHRWDHCELAHEDIHEFKRLGRNSPFPRHVYKVAKYVSRDGGVSFQGLQKSQLGRLTWRGSSGLKYDITFKWCLKILAWKVKLYIT